MFAVIKTGGKQYRVKPGDKIKVEKIDAEVGKEVTMGEVLLFAESDKEVKIGKPLVKGAEVVGKVLKQGRSAKVIVFKYKPKKRYHKKRGHRQAYTELEITSIKS